MREGMLWHDNSEKRTVSEKIQRASDYYQTKYLEKPTLCFIHPILLLDGPVNVEGVEIRTTNSVLPNHFWLGMAKD